jgi:thioredoxin-related protein
MRLVAFAALTLLTPAFAQEPTWLTDFEAAKAAAKKENKVILADFTGSDWCGWCIKLKDEVFSKPEFASWAKDKVILLELDYPRSKELPAELKEQNARLKTEYGIRGYPTVLLLDAEGKQVGKLGYKAGGPAVWTKLADEQLAQKPAAEAGQEAGAGGWLTDYKAAIAQAKAEKKIVIADFTGSDWCGWCIKLKQEVFDQPEFQAWAKDNAVMLELDFPRKKKLPAELAAQNKKLAAQFKIEGYPTIVFLDGSGKEIGRGGYEKGGPAAWIAMVEKETGHKSKKPKPAK